MTRFLLSSNPANLTQELGKYERTATVEAEYGETVVEGSVLTLAHHGPRAGNPCPCLVVNHPQGDQMIEAVGLSHFDLDTLGGCAAILGYKREAHNGFWQLAAFVDTAGPHKVAESGASDEDIRRLYAFWAWSNKNRLFPSRDGSVLDVTDKVDEGIGVVITICADEPALLAAGDDFRAAEETLNKGSFVEAAESVIVRVSPQFTNSLYRTPEGALGRMVVALNLGTGGVTVSLADPIPGVSARAIVQSIWGPEAGGHDGIAGSPRGQRMGLDDLVRARDVAVAALRSALGVAPVA